jgi:hypothetical protein
MAALSSGASEVVASGDNTDLAETQWRGIPAMELSEPLVTLTLSSCDASPPQGYERCREVLSGLIEFNLQSDFNNDGRRDTVEVGIAELPSGERSSFLVVATIDDPSDNQVFLWPGSVFTVVYWQAGKVYWNNCIECGHAIWLAWDAETQRYWFGQDEMY